MTLLKKKLIDWLALGTRGSRVEGPHTRGTSLGGVPREQKMLKGHLPRVMYHQILAYEDEKISGTLPAPPRGEGGAFYIKLCFTHRAYLQMRLGRHHPHHRPNSRPGLACRPIMSNKNKTYLRSCLDLSHLFGLVPNFQRHCRVTPTGPTGGVSPLQKRPAQSGASRRPVASGLRGYFAHLKQPPPRTLH